MTTATTTALMAHEVDELPAPMILSGLELGVVTRHATGFAFVQRHCEICGEALPFLIQTPDGPKFDVFPLCSGCAL
ncbi:MAG TPA: hypothetical protein VHX38_02445 [Pseudonocardiaceae bacterium]|jgi:hypothetical protein|nr:hypothetical protein [Pseudonocardiaceae bacterium]